MKIKAILFDVDNTLIDFMKMKQEAVRAGVSAMIAAGLPMKQIEAECEIWRLYQEYGYEYQKIFQKVLKHKMGRVDYSVLSAGVVAYKRKKEGFLVPYPGVKDTLPLLRKKGYKLGILSDAPRIQAWLRLASMGLHKMFDVVVTFDDTGKRKPSLLPFKKAIEKLKVKPENIVMVGDSIKRDIKSARCLGMKTILARYGKPIEVRTILKGHKYEIEHASCRLKKVADYELMNFGEIIDAIKYLENKI